MRHLTFGKKFISDIRWGVMISGKVWGSTQEIFKNANFEINRIFAKKDHYCSKHRHKHKHNLFYVESGQLEIYVEKNDYNLVDKTTLTDGQRMNVAPEENHYFKAVVDTVAYEVYYTQPIGDDIIRETVGG